MRGREWWVKVGYRDVIASKNAPFIAIMLHTKRLGQTDMSTAWIGLWIKSFATYKHTRILQATDTCRQINYQYSDCFALSKQLYRTIHIVTNAAIGAWKFIFPLFKEVMTHQPTKRPTNWPTDTDRPSHRVIMEDIRNLVKNNLRCGPCCRNEFDRPKEILTSRDRATMERGKSAPSEIPHLKSATFLILIGGHRPVVFAHRVCRPDYLCASPAGWEVCAHFHPLTCHLE